MKILSMQEIEQLYSPGIGRHWFDDDSKRFFKCRLAAEGYQAHDGRVYFVSSEKGPNGIRAYTVRCLTGPKGRIETVGEFQGYCTSRSATAEAKRLAASIESIAA